MVDAGAAQLSSRVRDTLLGSKESWTRRMFELAGQLQKDGGGPVHDLSLGNPSLEPPTAWQKAVVEVLEDEPPGMHRYMTNAGFPEVREFLAGRESARYGLELNEGHVLMTVGAAGAVNVFFRAILDPGDTVMVPAPYFTEYDHYCTNVGAQLVPVRATDAFEPDVDAMMAALTDRTRAILINSPNNPTGAIYSEAVLRRLADALRAVNETRERPVVVLEDSPYRDLTYDGSDVPSMMRLYEHTALLTSHSKDLGLAGERIGYIALSPKMAGVETVARGLGFCNRVLGFVNAPALMQRVLPKVLGTPEGRVDVEVYARRCRKMAAGLKELGFGVSEPRAGFFLFPRLPESLRGDEDADVKLTDALLAKRTIVVPGTAFGVPGHLRLSMATPDAAVDGALAAFREVCS
ncbi:MAG: pyridoxal phosphate-dependent aminotransferase [Nannocystales bacterium]